MNNITVGLRSLTRKRKLAILVLADFCIALSCWIVFGPPLSFMIASNFEISLIEIIFKNYLSFLIPVSLTFIYFYFSGFYLSLMRFFDSKDSIFRALTGSLLFGYSWGLVYLAQYEIMRTQYLPTVLLQCLLLASVLYAFIQISRDVARILIYPTSARASGKPVLIYGAGAAGNELYQAIKLNPAIRVIGFFDNSVQLKHLKINSIKIYWKPKHIQELSKLFPDMEVYLAIPSLSMDERRVIITGLEHYKIAVRTMPALHEIVADQKKMVEMQDLSIDDILPRARVKQSGISFEGETVMVTGGGGSIGSEIIRQIISGKPKKIVIYELSEINLYSIQSEAEAIKLSSNINFELIGILGDVKNKSRLINIINSHSVNSIYHAAAYKHVPIVEYYENISEGIKNNLLGTKAVCEAAVECNVNKVVVISTDKAVRPTNIMGASKRLAEMVVQSIDSTSESTIFCMVRFGNVINSSGSVIPLFRKQIADGGPLTITHKEVTRFFMTIAEASSLVIEAGEYAEGGDVFILDMGEQVKIMDLAEKLIYLSGRNISHDGVGEGIEIREIGLRPGEKLYEELLISGEEAVTPNDKIFKSLEDFPSKEILNKAIVDLNEAMETNNLKKIRDILKTHVEGFNDGAK